MPALYSSRTADKFVVRLPEGMRERISDVAKGNHRSMNSEIIARLEATLDKPEQMADSIEVVVPEGTIWTPVIGMVVRCDKVVGPILGFREIFTDQAILQVQLNSTMNWFNLADCKPLYLKS